MRETGRDGSAIKSQRIRASFSLEARIVGSNTPGNLSIAGPMIKAFVLRRKGLLNPPVCQGPRKVERNCAIVARRSRVIGRRNHQIPKAGLNVSGPRHRDWAVSAKRQRHHQIPADQGERSGVAEVHRLGFLSHAARVGTNGALPAPLPLDKRNTRSLIRVGWCGGMECRVGGEVSPGCLPIPTTGAHSPDGGAPPPPTFPEVSGPTGARKRVRFAHQQAPLKTPTGRGRTGSRKTRATAATIR